MLHDPRYRPLDGGETERVASAPAKDDDGWTVMMPVPEGRTSYWPVRGKRADVVWRYLDANGCLLGLVGRWELLPDGAKKKDKKIRPFTWCRDEKGLEEWREKHFPEPRPLYGLDRLAARPGAPVIVCEGEKSCDAATLILPDYVGVTSPCGANAAHKADWTPLAKRSVVIWPDRSKPSGRKYAKAVADILQKLGCDLAIIDAESLAGIAPDSGENRTPPSVDQWDDAADALAEWTDLEALRKTALACAGPIGEGDEGDEAIDVESESDDEERSPGTEKNSKFPPGFKMTPAGLKYRDPDKQEDAADVFVCGPIEVLARTYDTRYCGWGVLIRWKDPKGHLHEWSIPKAALAGDGAELRRVLLDEGLNIGSSMKARNLLTQFLTSVRADGFIKAVKTTGWHGDVFVFPDCCIGDAAGEHTVLQTDKYLDHNFNVSGTLDDWKQNVASFAVGNSRLVFSISIAFASCLLGPCRIESGGFHLLGLSSRGKTTIQTVAGSVWGGGEDKYARSWKATANGLEMIAAAHNSALLVLDELSQVSAAESGNVVYMLANEVGKSRGTKELRARKALRWRLLFLSSGEISLADKIAEDGKGRKPTAGQAVRLVEIPADTGVHGVFENLHGFADGGQFADHLTAAATVYYGLPARTFIEAIVSDLGSVKERVKADVQSFIDAQCPKDADGQVRRVCGRFALAAVAGELASGLGILPWPAGEATKATVTCFKAWINVRGGVESSEVTGGIAAVRSFLSAHGSARFEDAWTDRPTDHSGNPLPSVRIINQAGFKKRVETDDGEAWDFFVTPEAWHGEVTKGFNGNAVARTLAERGYLVREKPHLTQKPRVPGHGSPRVFHILAKFLEGDADV